MVSRCIYLHRYLLFGPFCENGDFEARCFRGVQMNVPSKSLISTMRRIFTTSHDYDTLDCMDEQTKLNLRRRICAAHGEFFFCEFVHRETDFFLGSIRYFGKMDLGTK